MPVGAGRRKNKSSSAKDAGREQAQKALPRDPMEASFLSFPGLLDQGLGPYGAGVASFSSSQVHMACSDHLYAFTLQGVTVTSRHRNVIVPLHSVDGMAF